MRVTLDVARAKGGTLIGIVFVAGWLVGAAFWFGYSVGSLQEMGTPTNGITSPGVWLMWPAFVAGRHVGQWHMARKLAPERMRQKLMQQEQLQDMANNWTVSAQQYAAIKGGIYGTTTASTTTWTP
jgi:hypothetical protein